MIPGSCAAMHSCAAVHSCAAGSELPTDARHSAQAAGARARLRVRVQELAEGHVLDHARAELRPLQAGQRAQAAVQRHVGRRDHVRVPVAQLDAHLRARARAAALGAGRPAPARPGRPARLAQQL